MGEIFSRLVCIDAPESVACGASGKSPAFEIEIRDYLKLFPPDPDQAVHIETGSWSGYMRHER